MLMVSHLFSAQWFICLTDDHSLPIESYHTSCNNDIFHICYPQLYQVTSQSHSSIGQMSHLAYIYSFVSIVGLLTFFSCVKDVQQIVKTKIPLQAQLSTGPQPLNLMHTVQLHLFNDIQRTYLKTKQYKQFIINGSNDYINQIGIHSG